MNLESARAGRALLEGGEAFAWVTILDTQGSSPRHAGSHMLVRAGGSITGTIGGGPLEGSIIGRAVAVIAGGRSSLEHFDAAQLGMRCGGGGRVLIDRVDPGDAAALELFVSLVGLLESGGRGWLVTVLGQEAAEDAAALVVRRCLVDAQGRIAGDPAHPPEDLQELARRGGTSDRILGGDPVKTHVESVGGQGTAYVFGAGHCGQKLVPVLSELSFFTVVVDDRSDFASAERFPTADRIVVPGSFDDVVATLPIDRDSYVVIITRGHDHDQSVLAQTLRTPARYIGMIGSRRKVAGTFKALGEAGFSADDLARVHAPIGLDIGAETPEEIAISIAAQLVQVRSEKGSAEV